uniref:Uncharacterized protein n=1 Tax=Anguilla anguilla TaxID=7936 RepID=A0A0E9U529_ANGAN
MMLRVQTRQTGLFSVRSMP